MLPGSSIKSDMIYGTAWKKDCTANLVLDAIKSGFLAFDTAAQPRHYRESLVGDAIRQAISLKLIGREDIYVSCSL